MFIEEEDLHSGYLVYETGEVGLYCLDDVHLAWRRKGGREGDKQEMDQVRAVSSVYSTYDDSPSAESNLDHSLPQGIRLIVDSTT